jgi:predicted DsbA family dithiol-disulfide isomerase
MTKILRSLPLCLVAAVIFACNSANHSHPEGNTKTSPKSATDSLYEAVIALHDEAMPKMGKLMGYEKAAQQKIDSLSKLKSAEAKIWKGRYQELHDQLQKAQSGMNTWMDQFEPDPQNLRPDSLLQYWNKQKAAAQAMRNDIFKALDSAAVLLK